MHRDKTAKNTTGLLADPGAIAPSVDKGWRDDFIVELRLRDVPGATIGDALVTVESHVRESGESAQKAFGEPRTYARDLAPGPERGWRGLSPAFLLGNLLGLIGLMAVARAFGSWLEGGRVEVVTGDLVSIAVLLGLVGLITVFFGRFIRTVMDHPWWVFAFSFAVLGALVAVPVLLLREPLFEVSPLVLGAVGVVLLLGSSVIAYLDGRGDPDEITAPGQEPTGAHAGLLTASILPLATVVVLVITWIPTLFT